MKPVKALLCGITTLGLAVGAAYAGGGAKHSSAPDASPPLSSSSESSASMGSSTSPLPPDSSASSLPSDNASSGASRPSNEVTQTFTTLDKDQNEVLSKLEAEDSAELKAAFDRLDTNKDGQLDRSEYQAIASADGAVPTPLPEQSRPTPQDG